MGIWSPVVEMIAPSKYGAWKAPSWYAPCAATGPMNASILREPKGLQLSRKPPCARWGPMMRLNNLTNKGEDPWFTIGCLLHDWWCCTKSLEEPRGINFIHKGSHCKSLQK